MVKREPMYGNLQSMVFILPLIDLRKLSFDNNFSEKQANYLANEESKHPFDLINGPILRVNIIILPSPSPLPLQHNK